MRSKLVHKTCPWSVATLLSSELCTRIVAAKVRREPLGSLVQPFRLGLLLALIVFNNNHGQSLPTLGVSAKLLLQHVYVVYRSRQHYIMIYRRVKFTCSFNYRARVVTFQKLQERKKMLEVGSFQDPNSHNGLHV